MNNTFYFKRFSLLLAKDSRDMFRTAWRPAAVIAGIYLFYYLLIRWMTGGGLSIETRMSCLLALMIIFAILLPFKIYGNVNDRTGGVTYALLPASTLEKFLSMTLTAAIIAPLIFDALLITADTLLSFIGKQQEFTANLFTTGYASERLEMIRNIGKIFLFQSLFFYGNLFFKKHKISSTFAVIILFHALLILLGTAAGFWIADLIGNSFSEITSEESSALDMFMNLSENSPAWLETIGNLLSILYLYGIPITMYILSYFRIKNLQYR